MVAHDGHRRNRVEVLKEDGERYLPWMADPVIGYEHLHRYCVASDLVGGRRILDMASGEGYGSALLAAGGAALVVGADIDHEAVLHATRAYERPGLRFVQASITALPMPGRAFDVVVCFEALEHVEDQDGLCREAARLLSPEGLLLISTPNRAVYSEAAGYENPFHVKELSLDELQALIAGHFRFARIFGQRIYPVSALFPLQTPVISAREHLIAREPGAVAFGRAEPDRKQPRYFLCVASHRPLPEDLPVESYLVDASEQLFEAHRRAEGAVEELGRHVAAREAQVIEVERHLRAQLEARATQAEELDRLLRERGQDLQRLAETAESLRRTVAAMEATKTWRLHRRVKAVQAALGRIVGRRVADLP